MHQWAFFKSLTLYFQVIDNHQLDSMILMITKKNRFDYNNFLYRLLVLRCLVYYFKI